MSKIAASFWDSSLQLSQPPDIHTLGWLPPSLYYSWSVWPTARGRSGGMSFLRRGCERLWLPYESLPSPPPQSWVTPCWRSSFPDVHSPKKIPPGRNNWPGTLAASGWRRELGSEFFNPTPALTSILVTTWENVSQSHLAKSLPLPTKLSGAMWENSYAGMCPCRFYTATKNWETQA